MTTLANLEVMVARDLRDSSNGSFATAELDDLINQGIDELATFYPKEIVQTIGTVSGGVISYSAASFSTIYRLDIYTSAGSYKDTMPPGIGGANSGWELHGGVLYLPPSYAYSNTDTLRAWGYGRYIQLSASSDTTDLDTAGIFAVRLFAQVEAFGRLATDRALFQQWQANPGNTDVSEPQIVQWYQSARQRWRDRQRSLRRMRKTA